MTLESKSTNEREHYDSHFVLPENNINHCKIEISPLKKGNFHTDTQTECRAASNSEGFVKKYDCVIKMEIKDEYVPTDPLKLHGSDQDIVMDNFKRECGRFNQNVLGGEDRSNAYMASSSWQHVPAASTAAAKNNTSSNSLIPGSDKYSVVVEVKTEKIEESSTSVKLDNSTEGSAMLLNNEYLINNGHSIFGEDYSPDVSLLARAAEEKAKVNSRNMHKLIDKYPQLAADGFEKSNKLSSHPEPSVDNKASICSRCGYKTTDPCHMECLVVTQLGEKPYSCEICKKAFKFKNKLITHLRIHIGDKPFKCDVCEKSFRLKNKLKVHSRIHTNIKPYVCHICNKGFFEGRSLKYHITTHTDDKPFPCDVCQKSFAYSSGLQRHMKIHTGDRPYSCHVCQKTFKQKCNLERHLRVHSGEKPYPCHICKKNFVESGHLQIHLRIHSGEKPFACEVCDKRFTIKNGLQRHMRIHTGDRPYSCRICQRTFNEKSNFIKHTRICNKKPFNKKLLNFIPEIIYLTTNKKQS